MESILSVTGLNKTYDHFSLKDVTKTYHLRYQRAELLDL